MPSRMTIEQWAIRALDVVFGVALLLILLPVGIALAVLIKLDSPGPVFFRCDRVGRWGSQLRMLKFRKMRADASGPPLTVADDGRFTGIGRFLAASKLDELPQLLHVVRGEMSLVGPRPESRSFVDAFADDYDVILDVKPGMTGLSQLAFARESEILDPQNRVDDYVERVLPQKLGLDALYALRQSAWMNVQILAWTAVAVIGRRAVAVDRGTGSLGVRRRPTVEPEAMPSAIPVPGGE
jgi:lipopolysaccharide/colanic/teichoic acid biosynthesis glycosyltransferase